MLRKPTRTESLELRLFPVQLHRYQEAARLQGMPVSEWAREVLTVHAMAVMNGGTQNPAMPPYAVNVAATPAPSQTPDSAAEVP